MDAPDKKKVIGFFQIIMINIIAIDSVRILPFSAQFGFSLLFIYLIAALAFFIPSALVSAELGTGWPERGGLYIWVREAFGTKIGLVAIWLNWVYNLAWYPTIMALIAGVAAYTFDPALAQNRFYMVSVILILFWAATYLNCHGMRLSTIMSTLGALIGTIFPMLAIIILGIVWVALGYPSQIEFSFAKLIPNGDFSGKLPYFSNVIFGLLGLEMVATHAAEMKDPKRDYPKATMLSVAIILTMMICASMSIAVAVPNKEINLVVGILQAFTVFFKTYHIEWMTPIMAACIALGALSCVSAWIIGPTKGLMVASHDGHLPKIFTRVNSHGVPTGAVFVQAIIVSLLSLAFVLMPTVNSSFFILSIITAQHALIVYIILFAASIKLHYHKSSVKRSYKIPGGSFGISLVATLGITVSIIAIASGFIPPVNVYFYNVLTYELLLILGMMVLSSLPLAFSSYAKRRERRKANKKAQ